MFHSIFLGIAFMCAQAFAATPENFLWKKRLIVVKEAKLVAKQSEVFKKDKKGYKERKLEILHFPLPIFQKDKTLCCALVGLDGEVKATSKELFNKDFVFSVIDSMPMRQSELKNKPSPEKKN